MRIIKRTLYTLYILLIVCMGYATFTEKEHGTLYVAEHIYGAWWFAALWAMLAAAGAAYFISRHIRRVSTVLLHVSFIIILLGALLTHLTAKQGMIHLRQGEMTDKYAVFEGDEIKEHALPFSIRMDKFSVEYHNGTSAAADYITLFTVYDNGTEANGAVSMNKIYSHGKYRLYQSSYDEDMRGSSLSMNSDPYGIPVTYLGYALLFISLTYILLDPKGTFQRLLDNLPKDKALRTAMLIATLVLTGNLATAQTTVPRETADNFGRLYMMYNDRICPVQTFAIDFTKKIYGKSHYKDFTAEQVLLGFIFWGNEWSGEPIIRIKGGDMKEQLGYDDYCSVNFFFNNDMGGYIIGPYVREYYNGNHDGFHKQAMDIDQKLMLIMDVRHGTILKMFPNLSNGHATWHSPTEKLEDNMSRRNSAFIQNAFGRLYKDALTGDYSHFNGIIDEICTFQKRNAGSSLPSAPATLAERIYNSIPFATILFMLNLTMGLLSLVFYILKTTGRTRKSIRTVIDRSSTVTFAVSMAALTLCLALRWIVSGNIPMANGYETMLLTAWLTMLLAVIAFRRFRIMLTFGFFLSGFFLLASHISYMDPKIGQLMPVLNSPLLSIHVSIIMMAYAMLSVTFICGIAAIIANIKGKSGTYDNGTTPLAESLHDLSRLFLYPALTCLGFGIFIGAIWANVSWGQYWSWDPKETWALITFMVYGIAVHSGSLPLFRNPMTYHVYMTIAFLTLLMTYFGVNYFLGGMHSYA